MNTNRLLEAAIVWLVSVSVSASASTVWIDDNYSSGSVTKQGNFYARDIDDNSHFANSASSWSVSGGGLQNSADSNDVVGEGAVARGVDVQSATGINSHIQLSFDYTLTSASESLSLFLIGTIGNTTLRFKRDNRRS